MFASVRAARSPDGQDWRTLPDSVAFAVKRRSLGGKHGPQIVGGGLAFDWINQRPNHQTQSQRGKKQFGGNFHHSSLPPKILQLRTNPPLHNDASQCLQALQVAAVPPGGG